MVGRSDGKWVFWPHYFDRTLTRAKGRRVAANLAIENPKAGHVANAARSLGLKVELEDDARPSSAWHLRKGRILVAKTDEKKDAVIQAIAKRL